MKVVTFICGEHDVLIAGETLCCGHGAIFQMTLQKTFRSILGVSCSIWVSRGFAYSSPVPNDIPPIRFATSAGARLAYQVFGRGPADIVAIPPTAQSIELAWERPEIRYMFDRFASFSRYLHFDKRGTGASDRRSHIPGIDERVSDVEAVMDAAGIERAHFFAASEGGPMAILFAATYPERVQSLILTGSCAAWVDEDISEEALDEIRRRHRQFAQLWGTPESPVVAGFAPSLATDPDFRMWHQRYERAAATPDSLVELLDLTLEMNVREVLSEITVPTLVMHRTGDRVVPVEWGRELADRIPCARMFEQDGDDHFFYAGDVDGWMDEVERFVTGSVSTPSAIQQRVGVRIETLGRFAVIRDGFEVPISAWGSKLARQICKRLAAARGWPVTREQLIDMCWPDEHDMRRLSARLSVQLSTVRRILGRAVIADRSTVRLDLDMVSTDLEVFWSASDDAAIVAAFAGEFLPGDVYEDWTGPFRDEIRTRFVTAARRVAHDHSAAGRHRQAVAVGRRLLAVDCYDADAHELVITGLEALGETGEATRARAVRDASIELGD